MHMGFFMPSIVANFLLLVASFFAGALNAAAGGGTFLTLPALMLVGVPPVAANATSTMALLPGYLASAWGFREDLRKRQGVGLVLPTLASLAGGAIGAGLLLMTPDREFRRIVPWLMAMATLLFAIGPRLLLRLRRTKPAGSLVLAAGMLVVSAYGGYFSGGLGLILLALLGLLGQTDLNFMNGFKNLISFILTAIAVLIYAWGGTVVWGSALLMMTAVIVGGYAGARLARRLPEPWLRCGIVLIGAVMTVLFFFKW